MQETIIPIIPALITLGTIMVLGFIGNYIFNKTQIPSIVWLLIFGLIVGFIFNIQETISQDLLGYISSFFGSVAIVIILFDGGINIDIYQLFRGAPRGLLLTISGFCLTVIATMLIIVGLSATIMPSIPIEQSVMIGVILGAMVGGTSSPIVIPLASRLKNLQEKTKMVTSIESVLTDPLCIVVVLAIVYMVSAGGLDFGLGARSLVSTFSVGIVLGLILGFAWLPIMHKVRKQQFSYVLTLAVVFLVYSLTVLLVGEETGGTGAGAIACLMFGLVLGNGKKVLKMVNYSGKGFEMNQETKQFHALTSFIIRTFFFVYLGIIVSFQKVEFIIIGIIVLFALLAVRYFAVFISTLKGGFEKDDKQTMAVMMPRGLAAAILAINFGPFLVGKDGILIKNVALEGFFQEIVFVIILGTAIVCTIGVSIISHYEMKKVKQQETPCDNIDNIINQNNENKIG